MEGVAALDVDRDLADWKSKPLRARMDDPSASVLVGFVILVYPFACLPSNVVVCSRERIANWSLELE
jgi:hypothetical protein